MTNKEKIDENILEINDFLRNQNLLLKSVLAEVRADLFYQIESKHGAKAASEYPCIIKANELLKLPK